MDLGPQIAFFFEVLIGGLLSGVMYSLVALGFVLIYKASGVFNFAQGAMVFFAALTYVGLLERGLAPWSAVPANHGRGKRPVVNVTWENAKSYVGWLARKTGKHYRLLTEAEWEYAARAGTTSRYATGDAISPNQANYDGSTDGSGPLAANRQKTLPVGSFRANGFGLYDMHGNAMEWTEDCWHTDYTAEAPTDCASPCRS